MNELDNSSDSSKSRSKRVRDIRIQLSILDIRSARSIRAILAGKGTEEDREYLSSIEDQAILLREELHSLTDKDY